MDGQTQKSSRAPSNQRWFILALACVFAILAVQYSLKVLGKEGGSAIVRWKNQLQEIDDGENPYVGSPYPNPPIMGVLLIPFARMPPLVAALTWYFLKVAMAVVAIFWVFRLVETREQPFPPWAKMLVVVLSLRPIMGDLSHGNINIFILFLVVGCLIAYRQRHELTSGIVLGLAIACKVTPILFIPYFVWKRAWKTLAGSALGMVLFFGPIPGLFLGQHQNLQLFKSWADKMVKPFVVQGVVFYSEHNNQSLPGLVLRLGTHSPSFSTYINDQYTPLRYHNFVALDAAAARWIIKLCILAFMALAMWTCRTPVEPRRSWRLAAEFSLVILGMLLFSERTWKHHCVTLLLPWAVLCYYLAVCRPHWLLRWYLVGSVVAVVLLMFSTSTFKVFPRWDETAKLAQVYGAYVWAYIVLAAALMAILRQDSPIEAETMTYSVDPQCVSHPV